jgi:hypothetical protein
LKEIKEFNELLPQVNATNFSNIALEVYRFQYKNNLLYQSYAKLLGKVPDRVKSLSDIPFLPIRFFKTHQVITGNWKPQSEFESSSTTGVGVSRHAIHDSEFYLQNSRSIFESFYGPVTNFHFLALLPSYLERKGSSLIAMIDHFIKMDSTNNSGFYLKNHGELIEKIKSLEQSPKKIILWGVSFALLDLAEKNNLDLSNCIVLETGGMKGRRKEMVRRELHELLKNRFNIASVDSEYGMTELFSQAYARNGGYFKCPPWMKASVRDINDPFEIVAEGKTGAINIIDLANVHSCAFIETEDIGVVFDHSGFEVLGRMDNSDVRGCNLLVN